MGKRIEEIMKVVMILVFVFCLRGFCGIKVGIYYPWASGGESYGGKGIYDALQKEKDIEADLIKGLEPEVIFNYDVIILPAVHKLGAAEVESNWRLTLSNYVDSGYGIMLTHDSCGYRHVFNIPLFPQICTASGKTDHKEKLIVIDNQHPITQGVEKEFRHAYWDHINLIPGNKGKSLIKDVDGNSVLVAGELGNGRVMAFGCIPGYNDKEVSPENGELKVIVNGVRWLAGGTKRKVSLQETEKTIFAEAIKINESQEKKFDNLPKSNFKFKMICTSTAHSPWILNKEDALHMVDDIYRMGFNVIWITGFGSWAYYNSTIAQTFPEYCRSYFPKEIAERVPLYNEFDPLKVIIEEAHKKDIKVFACVCPFRGGYRNLPEPFYKQHPEYLQYSGKEIRDLKSGKLKGPFDVDSVNGCPDRPEVRQRALNIIKEIIDKYPVDGIALDYIRYNDERSCWCDYSVEKRKEYAKNHPELFEDEVEAMFSEESIVSFVKQVRETIKKTNPKVELMAYTHPLWANKFPLDYHSKRCSRGIDESYPLPVVKTLCEELVKMSKVYYPYTKAVPDLDLRGKIEKGEQIQKPAEIVIKEIRIAYQAGADGVMLFHYQDLLRGYPNAERDVHRPIFSPFPLRPTFDNENRPVMQAIADEFGGIGWKK